MKCERCGNQLDDTDLFCQKCGKAVFEEYMDDDDIWDEYDREPKVGSKEKLEIEAEEAEQKENETKTEEQEQQPEAKPEEVEQKKQDYFVMADKEGIDFSQYTRLAVANAEQSSMASSGNYDYSAKSAADGDITSSWQEGVEGLGEGTGIKLSLDGTHKIRYIVLYLGNWRSDEMWQKNARPAKLSINLGDNQAKDVEFSDEKKAFCLSFDEPVEASFVSLYIQAGYAGAKWNDNCISEVEFYE